MTELRPLLDEYAELEKAAQRLGIVTAVTEQTPSRRAGRSRASTAKRPSKPPRAPAGSASDDAPASAPDATPAAQKRAPAKAKLKRGRNAVSAKKNRQPGGARSGERAEQVAMLVAQRPGISVKELGAEVGVDPTSLYRVVKQLESDGRLVKRGHELHPA